MRLTARRRSRPGRPAAPKPESWTLTTRLYVMLASTAALAAIAALGPGGIRTG